MNGKGLPRLAASHSFTKKELLAFDLVSQAVQYNRPLGHLARSAEFRSLMRKFSHMKRRVEELEASRVKISSSQVHIDIDSVSGV